MSDIAFADGNRTLLAVMESVTDRDREAGRFNCSVARWDLPTGKELEAHVFDPIPEPRALSPDGRFALLHQNNVGQSVFDLTSGRKVFALNSSGEFVFSDDGWPWRRIAAAELRSGKFLREATEAIRFQTRPFRTRLLRLPGSPVHIPG